MSQFSQRGCCSALATRFSIDSVPNLRVYTTRVRWVPSSKLKRADGALAVPRPPAALDLAGLPYLIVTDLSVQIVPCVSKAGLGLGEPAGPTAVLVALRHVRQGDRPGPPVDAATPTPRKIRPIESSSQITP